jgi:DNA-binding NtrC family response regulator
MDTLIRYSWPGNVRELKNCLARAVILSKNSFLGIEDFPEKIVKESGVLLDAQPTRLLNDIPEHGISLKDMERELIAKTLEKCDGNKTTASKRLGISRKALYEKMERLGITK